VFGFLGTATQRHMREKARARAVVLAAGDGGGAEDVRGRSWLGTEMERGGERRRREKAPWTRKKSPDQSWAGARRGHRQLRLDMTPMPPTKSSPVVPHRPRAATDLLSCLQYSAAAEVGRGRYRDTHPSVSAPGAIFSRLICACTQPHGDRLMEAVRGIRSRWT
jgi:hypothetical protein